MNSTPTLSDHDRLALQQLAIDYANAIDGRAWDRLDRVFTKDAKIDYTALGGIAGSYPEVKAWLPRALRFFKSYVHFVGNFQFEIDGDNDHAKGQIACHNTMVVPGLLPGFPRTVVYGLWYVDEYCRTEEGWRISSRSERAAYIFNEPLWMKVGKWVAARSKL